MVKSLGFALGMGATVLFVGPATAKMNYAECRILVTQNPTYLDGKGRVCGRQCNAAIRRCVQNNGKFT
jgi:hypothetical protein